MDQVDWPSVLTQLSFSALMALQTVYIRDQERTALRDGGIAFGVLSISLLILSVLGLDTQLFVANTIIAIGGGIVGYRAIQSNIELDGLPGLNQSELKLSAKLAALALPFVAAACGIADASNQPWLLLIPSIVMPVATVVGIEQVFWGLHSANRYAIDSRTRQVEARYSLTAEKDAVIEEAARQIQWWQSEAATAETRAASAAGENQSLQLRLGLMQSRLSASERQSERLKNDHAQQIARLERAGQHESAKTAEHISKLRSGYERQLKEMQRDHEALLIDQHSKYESMMAETLRAHDKERMDLARQIGYAWLGSAGSEEERYRRKMIGYLAIQLQTDADERVPLKKLRADLDLTGLGLAYAILLNLQENGVVTIDEIGDSMDWTERTQVKMTQGGAMQRDEKGTNGPHYEATTMMIVNEAQAGSTVQQINNLPPNVSVDDLKRALAELMGRIDTFAAEDNEHEFARNELAATRSELSSRDTTDTAKLAGVLEKISLISRTVGTAAEPIYKAVDFVQRVLGVS